MTYRLGEAEKSHRKFYLILLLVLLAVGAAGYFGLRLLQPDTEIAQPPAPLTRNVNYDNTKLTTFEAPLFSIRLPSDWKATTRPSDIPAPAFVWQGTQKDNVSRWVSVYVDQPVSTLAVNRALSVQANATGLDVLSDVSDNCTAFTGAASQRLSTTPAKWQGVDFTCDSGNYERDVVGTTSPNGLNNVTLTGTKGSHRFFITYTDSSVSPDYSIFIDAMKSLKLK